MENDLIFSGVSPVIIDTNGSVDDIYAPISTRSADINLVSDSILDDLYTAGKDDIMVEIEYNKALYDLTVYMTDHGGVETESGGTNADWFEVQDKKLFYTNILGEFCYNKWEQFCLVYEPVNKVWIQVAYVFPGSGPSDIHAVAANRYFDDGDHWYRIYNNNYTWELRLDGTTVIPSQWTDGETTGSFSWDTISAYNVIHLLDGTIEILWGTDRYRWDKTSRIWVKLTPYSTDRDKTYTTIKGYRHLVCATKGGRKVDAVIVEGVDGDEDWVAEMRPRENKVNLMARLDSSADKENVFADDSGNLYCVKSSGEIWVWVWINNGVWEKWLTIGGSEARTGTFRYRYTIPPYNGDGSRHVVGFTRDSDGKMLSVTLSGLTPPRFTVRKVFRGYERTGRWNGYGTPNTYSQELSQNLDTITVTAIDPLAVLKYVTVDKILPSKGVMSYGEILGSVLAYVNPGYDDGDGNLDQVCNLLVERCVSYGGEYDGSNGLLDLRCQVSNFWDESGKAMTAHEVVSEMLRLFCLRIMWDSDGFWIYSLNNTTTDARTFDTYEVYSDGHIVKDGTRTRGNRVYELETDFISNNVSVPVLDITQTYDKVTAVASTSVPNHSRTAFDLVDYNDRDMYDFGWLNVQTNKTKGYVKETRMVSPRPGQSHPVTVITRLTDDRWLYVWNGVYANPEFNLEPDAVGADINWHLNINKAYEYLTGQNGNPDGTGSVLNFYGASVNPTGTGKSQTDEKSVELKKKITAYAPDNGIPAEFLEGTDLVWRWAVTGLNRGEITKQDLDNPAWGVDKPEGKSERIVYHQEYSGVTLSSTDDTLLNISLSKSFSRTGIDIPIDIMQDNTWSAGSSTADVGYFPASWNASNVKVDSDYFVKYATGGAGSSCYPVWDETRIDAYVRLSDGSWLQFTGKDWVRDRGDHNLPFYLGKMMTYQNLYHTEFRYNCIRSAVDTNSFIDSPKYSLGDEDYVFYYDKSGGVKEKESDDVVRCPSVKSQGISWIADCSDGNLSIRLPYVDDPGATVYVDIYNSSMLGMTGIDGNHTWNHGVSSENLFKGEGQNVALGIVPALVRFLPANISHVKAEHIDLSVTVTVPSGNLGQMFDESDIRYHIDSHKGYVEEYSIPEFKVNTRNAHVARSLSYLLVNNKEADPGEFIINSKGARPEAYTLQAHYDWLTRIRRKYTKTIKFLDDLDGQGRMKAGNALTLINSPEVSGNDLLVAGDSWDLKSHRHTVSAIEAQDLDVDRIEDVQADEIPRKARAERYNYPSAGSRRGGVRK